MKPSEAAVILTKIAAYDRRTLGESDAAAWAEALDGLVTVQDALTAVRDHFRESTEWLMPKHIIDRAREIRKRRIQLAGVPDFPPGLTHAQEQEWLAEWHQAIADNPNEKVRAQYYADRALGTTRVAAVPADPERVRRLIEDFANRKAVTS